MPLNNGRYRTEAGSRVEVSGRYAGIYDIEFDRGGRLGWQCECHGYFDAALKEATDA